MFDSATDCTGIAGFVARWLGSTGPVPDSRLAAIFGADPAAPAVSSALEDTGLSRIDVDGEPGWCDRDNLEALLRLVRRAARPRVVAAPAVELPRFVARMQGVRAVYAVHPGDTTPSKADPQAQCQDGDCRQSCNPAPDTGVAIRRTGNQPLPGAREDSIDGIGQTRRALESLSGFPAPAAVWESNLLPARVEGYRPSYLDELLAAGEVIWYGTGYATIAFVTVDDFEAFASQTRSSLLPPDSAPEDFWTIRDRTGFTIAEAETALWKEIWNGAISSTDFGAVRLAITRGFKPVTASGYDGGNLAAGGRYGVRTRELDGQGAATGRPIRVPLAVRSRWKTGVPVGGSWYALAPGHSGYEDKLDDMEKAVVRARAVARRYGIVCREVLEAEHESCRWSVLFPALRRLELSGDFVTGHFFDTIAGPQFMSQDAYRQFCEAGTDDMVWVVNATDPASPCITRVPERPTESGSATIGPTAPTMPSTQTRSFRIALPSRTASSWIVMQGTAPVCVGRRYWKDLDIAVSPDDPLFETIIGIIKKARAGIVVPGRRLPVETINGVQAAASAYAERLRNAGFDADRGVLTLW